ncbi:MAG: galactokinase [Calditrichaeota bacterium]|nr:galactokinase [Calditrichota bacterium]RQW00814.1 MAG: galactokinase [Calditrichota bacterium]
MDELFYRVEQKFKDLFKEDPFTVRSPGRVNLIGEHTDYNEGFVLPGAIDKAVYFAIAPNYKDESTFFALDLSDVFTFRNTELFHSDKQWSNYLLGVLDQLEKIGKPVPGFNCVFGGNIPIGAGLSSSAALEAGLIFSLNEIFHLGLDGMTMVKLSQRAENEFVGVQCGIMDQLINIFGQEKKVLKLDCRTLEFEYVPFEDESLKVILCDSQVQRELGASEYNLRRSQCEEGVAFLQKYYPDIKSLRDVQPGMLESHAREMDPVTLKRCSYVVQENQRVLDACQFLEEDNFAEFGRKMFQSHEGLRNLYEVSCPELDMLVDGAAAMKGVLGARMMGAGFGGCTINLVKNTQLEYFEEQMERIYRDKLKKQPRMYVSVISSGSEIIKEKVEKF